MLQILLAVLAGILTIAAPCILPLLPILLGTSVGQRSKTRPLFIVLGFVLTFTLAALLLSVLARSFGLNTNILRNIAVIVLAIFGVLMIWPEPFEMAMSRLNFIFTKASSVGGTGRGNWGGFILGMTLGLVWTPCAGPVLGSILTLIALQKELFSATILLFAYSLGAAVPMLLIAYGGQLLTSRVRAVAKYSRLLQQIFGVIILGLAIAIYLNYDVRLYSLLLNWGQPLQISAPAPAVNAPASGNPPAETRFKFENFGKAPDFKGLSAWLNSAPLKISDLKGKVVLIDFWTYSCINCIRTLPYVTHWYDTYKDQGLVVVGVHTPEFDFEKDAHNVRDAVTRFKIHYPVASDNNYGTWDNYNNQYWPAEYLIDQDGTVVYTHFGEGNYDHTENAIRALLSMKMKGEAGTVDRLDEVASPEMYFGTARLQNLSPAQNPSLSSKAYVMPPSLKLNNFALEGEWRFSKENVRLTGGSGKIKLNFSSGKLHLVAASQNGSTVKIAVDGKEQPEVKIKESKLYTLFDSDDYSPHTAEINIDGEGFEGFTFTFG